jgi:hypothetical protein
MCGSLLQPSTTLAVSWWLSLHHFHWLTSDGHSVTRRSNKNGAYGCAMRVATSSREVSIAPFLPSCSSVVRTGRWDATLVAVGTVSYSEECIWPWLHRQSLTLILLTWNIGWAPNNASKWQMGFNSTFKGLTLAMVVEEKHINPVKSPYHARRILIFVVITSMKWNLCTAWTAQNITEGNCNISHAKNCDRASTKCIFICNTLVTRQTQGTVSAFRNASHCQGQLKTAQSVFVPVTSSAICTVFCSFFFGSSYLIQVFWLWMWG